MDLVLNLVDGPVDGCNKLLPSNPKGFHGVLGVSVLKHEALLDLLIDPFKFLEMWLELVYSLLILSQSAQLLLKRSLHSHADGSNSVHLSLDPGSNLVGLLGKLSSEGFIVLLLLKFILEGLVSLWHKGLHFIPLGLDILASEICIGVDGGTRDIVLFGKGFTFVNQGNNRGKLFVSFSKSSLELGMGINETLNFIKGVHNEHINKVLPCSIQPVIERSCPLCKFQVKRVNSLQNLFGLIHTMSPLLCKCSKSVLVSCEIRFKSFMLLLHCLQFKDLAVFVVL